ncbi:type II secretion system F family protein [Yersinia mollaretii]|uniref:Type II secretion system F family protein n=1 Tax=Yersinia mollaretii TaxID=33060 RepID=A0AA44CKL6_YERMO|nr:type II secretion system F family protein [Yersinia mollaretii]NIL22568.1 type II secretion system F family protein [Yersinia mollaretii]CNI71632.1 Flp pilus assembly protein TadB [Yersinia mollaretii]CNK65500.1 Flp pilus assembly protein TadB [Yersinia enterocolitica]CQQ69819.1 Flp pilus assembly protein TadB [Yersinia mollaretii]
MIYYMISLSGLLLLIVSNLEWIKIKKSIGYTKKTSLKIDSTFIDLFKKISSEWINYLSSVIRDKNKPHIVIPLLYAIITYSVNIYWFHFNSVIILIFILISIIFFQFKISRKIHHTLFKRDLPEVLLMINMAASSGASINQVLERCGNEISGPLGDELDLICRRLNLGESPETVFYDAYQRFLYPEFYFLITIISLNLQQGGQLKELINRLSQVINKNKTSEQKKAVMTAQTRMSVNIISLMPLVFSILLYFLDPATMESMWNHSMGKMVFYYIIASEVIGITIIRTMLGKAL